MPISLGSPAARARELVAQLRLQAAHERLMAARLRRFLARLGATAAEAFARGGIAELERAVAASEAELAKLLDDEYRRVLLTFGRRVLDAAGKAAPQLRETKAPEPRFADRGRLARQKQREYDTFQEALDMIIAKLAKEA